MTHLVSADVQRLTVAGPSLPPGTVLTVLLGGRRIWAFRAPEPREPNGAHAITVPWPPALAERLTGRARLAVQREGTVLGEASVRFDGIDREFRLEEPGTGIPQVVNKWGRVARSFEGRDASLLDEVLDEAERLSSLVAERAGIDLFVTGGTLLGPVRDGHILPSDDDADLAYLSRHENPSDVALESFALERMLTASGYEVVRHSTGHLQLLFPGRAGTDRFYLDVFTYFVTGDHFYGTFHARQPAGLVRILPLRSLLVHNRMLPAPAEPEQLLEAIYGPGWATPDPAFTFSTPQSAARRFFWWLNHFDVDRENWEDRHRAEIQAAAEPLPSQLAGWASAVLRSGSSVVELASGLGADARHLAAAGHRVLAVDFSRPALAFAHHSAMKLSNRPRFERVNLNSTRQVLELRRQAAALDGPVHLYGRQLFDALSPLGWDTTLLFMKHMLAGGGTAFLEVELGGMERHDAWTDYHHVDRNRLLEQLDRYGLRIEEQQPDAVDLNGSTVFRMMVRSKPR
jgi:SAM-dependent methyltransferase